MSSIIDDKIRESRERDKIRERILAKVRKDGECWIWTGTKSYNGYGRQWNQLAGQMNGAHRLSYELFVREIPKDFFVDHLCKRHDCVNPKHLQAVTPRGNAVFNSWSPTAINRQKTHCVNGHPFNELNTYVMHAKTKLGEPVVHRKCRACMAVVGRRMWEKHKDKRNANRRAKKGAYETQHRAAQGESGEGDERAVDYRRRDGIIRLR